MEIHTNILGKEQFRQELADAMSFLAQREISDVAVSFGFTPDAPQLDDVGVGYTVPIANVPSFIADRERTKGFRLGLYDCWIEPLALRNVHVTSHSVELLDSICAHWRAKGFNVYPDDLRKNA
jgi:hypothetical protein